MDYLISARRPDLVIVNKKKKKKKTCWRVDFAVPADHQVKLREGEKRNKYVALAWELKKLWNMKVSVIPIIIGALGSVIKGLTQGFEGLEISGRAETIQPTALLRSVSTEESPWDLGKLAVTQTCGKPPANAGVKNS